MLKIFKFVFSRVIFVYLAVAAVFFCFVPYKTVLRSAALQTLSRLTPSFNYYTEFFERRDDPDPAQLDECAYYHEQVAKLIPSAAGEALGVATFCRYEGGRTLKAKELLGKAIAKTPVFFWNSYNLGIMALNEGDYAQAAEAFSAALQLDPKMTLLVLTRSKIYSDIRRSFGTYPYDVETNLAEGYRRTAVLLRICLACKADPEARVCRERKRLHLQLF